LGGVLQLSAKGGRGGIGWSLCSTNRGERELLTSREKPKQGEAQPRNIKKPRRFSREKSTVGNGDGKERGRGRTEVSERAFDNSVLINKDKSPK